MAAEPRGWGLSIALWLIMGFALVIAAFITGSLLARHGTGAATEELTRVRAEIEPLTLAARELGESSAAFDRAVLAYLGTGIDADIAALTAAGTRLSRAANEAPAAEASDGNAGDE